MCIILLTSCWLLCFVQSICTGHTVTGLCNFINKYGRCYFSFWIYWPSMHIKCDRNVTEAYILYSTAVPHFYPKFPTNPDKSHRLAFDSMHSPLFYYNQSRINTYLLNITVVFFRQLSFWIDWSRLQYFVKAKRK